MSYKNGTHTNKTGIMQAGLHTHPREQRYGNLWSQIDFMIKEAVISVVKNTALMLAKEAYQTGKSLDMV